VRRTPRNGGPFHLPRNIEDFCCKTAINPYKIEVCSPTTRKHISAALFCTHILAAIVRKLIP